MSCLIISCVIKKNFITLKEFKIEEFTLYLWQSFSFICLLVPQLWIWVQRQRQNRNEEEVFSHHGVCGWLLERCGEPAFPFRRWGKERAYSRGKTLSWLKISLMFEWSFLFFSLSRSACQITSLNGCVSSGMYYMCAFFAILCSSFSLQGGEPGTQPGLLWLLQL